MIVWAEGKPRELGDDRLRERDFLMYHFTTQIARPRMVTSPMRRIRPDRDDLEDVKWMEDQREQINPDDLTFVDMDDDAERPVKVGSFTGFKPGQKLLYLTELGGQPDMRIVTVEREAVLGGGIGLVIYVKEHNGYLDTQSLYSLESIQDKFDSYTDNDARRWRAIHDGITPAAMLSNEEIDKVIDDNEEWCKAYEERQREWSREDAEAELLDQIPEDQRHTDDEDDDVDKHIDGLDDLGGPSHVMGSSPHCQP